MANEIQIKVPDIGDATDVDIIEIHVQEGQPLEVDEPIVTLESDKASMEIPAPTAGKVKQIKISVGDKVSEGDVLILLDSDQASQSKSVEPEMNSAEKSSDVNVAEIKQPPQTTASQAQDVCVPDIGDAEAVDVIEIHVKPQDEVKVDAPLITLESDKATMDIPSPFDGIVESVTLQVGDKVSQGDLILKMLADASVSSNKASMPEPQQAEVVKSAQPKASTSAPVSKPSSDDQQQTRQVEASNTRQYVHAGPAVRRLARELGADLSQVTGTGVKGRITTQDLQQHIKNKLQVPSQSGVSVAPAPSIDFSKFGETEIRPLNKIKRITAQNMHRSWLTVPHVTQFDEADITELEAFRKQYKTKYEQQGVKLTPLAFITHAVARALMAFPQFNSSLDDSGESLIYKKYINIGIAVDTPNGLVVPVIKNVNALTVSEIASQMAALSQKARAKSLLPSDMSGGCFTISSLGGISGTAFTPIVNHPEVAILGVSRSKMSPQYISGEFVPRLMLPFSLSYDHRVIDGAEAARFTAFLSESLSDIRTLLL